MHNLRVEDTYFPSNKHLRLKDKLFDLSKPKVMGIINCTPDSFYSKSRYNTDLETLKSVEKLINEGVDIIDIGGYSSRPGAKEISVDEELSRILTPIISIKKEFGNIPLSIDTFRAEVARISLENGADIINDISAWEIETELLDIISHYKCPYILMHMKGTPRTMQQNTHYENIFSSIISFFSKKLKILKEHGIYDVILDPGFGFGKTLEQNYEILNKIEDFKILGKPILVGISRKSMIYNKLNSDASNSLNGTTILNTIAISKGASIIRVHDVKEAKEVINLLNF
jgi:dihydropteroate synthase